MDPFDAFHDFRRFLDTFRETAAQLEQVRRNLQATAALLPASDVLREYEAAASGLTMSADFAATTRALASALRPFDIDFQRFSPLVDFSALNELMVRVNAGIAGARFLGEIQLPGDESSADAEDDASTRQVESQLVEIAPAEALERLKRVGFAPIALLDRALRDPEIMRRLNARDFEALMAALVDQLGFEDVVLTPRSGDGGRDVLATKRIFGIAIMFAFECKRYAPNRPVGPATARALLGTIAHPGTRVTKGVLVTTSYFTPSARKFILTEPTLDGKDFDGIVDWLHEYGSRANRATETYE